MENGHIKRDFDDEAWFIYLDDILEFARKHGEIVVMPNYYFNPEIPMIEIYDTYRE